jgi:hypothetical protein
MLSNQERLLFEREMFRLISEHSKCSMPSVKESLYYDINLLNTVLNKK